ncbi:heme/hemin ABC transporter substrate-binding protein [Endozoicomonas elysicola]|uniref:heme/hemin ABC transporter substrate-binding protein n=1 Tax=Endozoicomonas elysicola TaxID=305900 RepID=UPI000369A202|nr:ABC transporter substrate-binding protein [Endozoicomonas elysicola]
MKKTFKPLFLSSVMAFAAAMGANTALAHNSHDNQRIVSAGNGVTEIIYALGAGDQVIAVDQTSTWPTQVNQLPRLGYHKQLSAEGILALEPTMLIGTEDMGPPSTLAQLESAGVEVEALPLKHTAESIENQIKSLADILGKEEQGNALWEDIEDSLDEAKALAASYEEKHEKKVPVLFVLAMGGRSPTIAGTGTAANAMIGLAGGYNPAAEQFKGYKALSNEAMLLLAPEVIIFPGSTSNPDMTPETLLEQMPILKQTPAGKSGRVVAIDGNMLLGGLGPRTGDVALSLAKSFYLDQGNPSSNES